jgi:hypothetical protein
LVCDGHAQLASHRAKSSVCPRVADSGLGDSPARAPGGLRPGAMVTSICPWPPLRPRGTTAMSARQTQHGECSTAKQHGEQHHGTPSAWPGTGTGTTPFSFLPAFACLHLHESHLYLLALVCIHASSNERYGAPLWRRSKNGQRARALALVPPGPQGRV